MCLQISDWLTLEQAMMKKHAVDVADFDAITTAVDKQKVGQIHNTLDWFATE